MTPLRVLTGCGLTCSLLSGIGGLTGSTILIGVANLVMFFGNVYAFIRHER